MEPKHRRAKWYGAAFAVMIILMFFSVPVLQGVPLQDIPQYFANLVNSAAPANTENTNSGALSEGEAAIYFLDVGQADCTAVLLPNGKTMVIDAGNNADGPLVCETLRSLGIEQIDFLIATHPHEDHIGGMDDVIRAFSIKEFYMPRVSDSQIPTTKTYESLLSAASEAGLKAKQAKAGVVLLDEEGIRITLLGPVAERYGDLNSYSAVVRLQVGNKSFLFMGDAECDAEEDILDQSAMIKSDVLKIGHHGSSTSTSTALLQAVSPDTAVISCGRGNDYGHPHQETLDKLTELNTAILRTDQDKTIAAFCDGNTIRFQSGLPSCDGNSP